MRAILDTFLLLLVVAVPPHIQLFVDYVDEAGEWAGSYGVGQQFTCQYALLEGDQLICETMLDGPVTACGEVVDLYEVSTDLYQVFCRDLIFRYP